MKIGIITYWGSQTNYGQVLQCYALQKFLTNLGHEAFLIRYDRESDIIPSTLINKTLAALNPFHLISHFANNNNTIKSEQDISEHNRDFDNFRNKYILQTDFTYKSFYELKLNPPVADIYITGSDQVWNYWNYPLYRYKNLIHSFFLDFGSPSIKRISYAASWGIKKLPDAYKKEISPLLKAFDFISIREKSGIDLCKQCGCENVEWVCDPTLLLKAEEYRKLYKENNVSIIKNKYILLYLLSEVPKSTKQNIFDFAKKKNLSIIYISGNSLIDEYEKCYPTIPEWLSLIDNAEYVITNSFHGAVFSTIFHKQYGILPFSKKLISSNERFDSLFTLFDIKERYIYNDLSVLDLSYKQNKISDKSESFLLNALNGVTEKII